MVSFLTRLQVADNCGILEVQCIKILGGSFVKRALPGSVIIVVSKRINVSKPKISVGLLSRALIVRSTCMFFRGCGIWLTFNQNAVVVTNKKIAPFGKRLRGPFLKEICINYNFLGTVTQFIV